jgi:hypothetical protein
VSFPLNPTDKVYWLEIFTDTELNMGEVTPAQQVSNVDIALHVFNQSIIGSHIFSRPTFYSLVMTSSITWAKEGEASTNAGFKTKPVGKLKQSLEKLPVTRVLITSPRYNSTFNVGDDVTFIAEASTSSPYDGPYTFVWTFSDGSTYTGDTIIKNFLVGMVGSQTATLRVLNLTTGLTTTVTVIFEIVNPVYQIFEYLEDPYIQINFLEPVSESNNGGTA